MRALHLHHHDQPTTLHLHTTTPLPTPSATQYLIRVHACAITSDELTWTETLSRALPIPAHDICGTVVSTPTSPSSSSPSNLSPGASIIALTTFSLNGGAAEYALADIDEVAPKPSRLSDIEAASMPLSFLTAYQALVTHARAEASQSVLILGASGGVGSMAVQVARWGLGMRGVVGTCSGRNGEFVRGLGAHGVVDYSTEEVEGTFDVVLDCVGGKAREDVCRGDVVKRGGVVVSVAAPFPEDMRARCEGEMGVKCIFFIVKPCGAELAKAGELIEKGLLKPVVDRVFPLEEGAEAFELLGKRHARGKIVLKI